MNEPTSQVRVRCEICQEVIGTIDRNTIEAPIMGRMFTSADPFHGFSAPFPDELEWEAMRCPHCRTRPFYAEDPETCVLILLENNEHIQVRNKPKSLPIEREEVIVDEKEGKTEAPEEIKKPPENAAPLKKKLMGRPKGSRNKKKPMKKVKT